MKLVPLGDRVVLKQLAAEETTKSGIVLPGQEKEKPQQAEVIAVGPGTEDVKMEVAVGDQIIYSKYSGTEVKLEEEKYIIVREYQERSECIFSIFAFKNSKIDSKTEYEVHL